MGMPCMQAVLKRNNERNSYDLCLPGEGFR
jgi:hypothetical protein